MFAIYFSHSEGWTTRDEVLLEKVFMSPKDTSYSKIITCVVSMESKDFVKGKWFSEEVRIIRIPIVDMSNCRSKGFQMK